MKEEIEKLAEEFAKKYKSEPNSCFAEYGYIAGYQKAMEAHKRPIDDLIESLTYQTNRIKELEQRLEAQNKPATITQSDEDVFRKIWYSRNPCHDLDQEGKDRFWKTAIMVAQEFVSRNKPAMILEAAKDKKIDKAYSQFHAVWGWSKNGKYSKQEWNRLYKMLIEIINKTSQNKPEIIFEDHKDVSSKSKGWENIHNYLASNIGTKDVDEFIMKVAELYANQFRGEQKWVIVDKPPIKEGEYLVFNDNLGGIISITWFSNNKWGYLGEGDTQKYPTHWQPLPSPHNKEG